MRRVSLLILLFCLSEIAPHSWAQSGELPTIQRQLIAEGQHAVTSPIRIQLLAGDGGQAIVAETLTTDGMARFPNVHPGTYVLQVTGSTIEDTQTPRFEIREKSLTSMQYVRVKLKSASGEVTSKEATIAANALSIPKKAQDEFDKASHSMQNKEWQDAISHLEKAISLYPQYAGAYNNLGVVSMQLKDPAKAKASFQKAIDLNDHTGSAHLNLGRLYFLDRNFEEAAKLIDKSIALDPNNPEALTILADCEFAAGRYQSAIDDVQRVHKLPHQRFAVAHLVAAAAYEKQNDIQHATAEYEQFLQEDPKSPRAASARKALERLASNQPGGAAPKP